MSQDGDRAGPARCGTGPVAVVWGASAGVARRAAGPPAGTLTRGRRPVAVAVRAARAATVAAGTVAVAARAPAGATRATAHVALGALLGLHVHARGHEVGDRRVARTDPVDGRVDLRR